MEWSGQEAECHTRFQAQSLLLTILGRPVKALAASDECVQQYRTIHPGYQPTRDVNRPRKSSPVNVLLTRLRMEKDGAANLRTRRDQKATRADGLWPTKHTSAQTRQKKRFDKRNTEAKA